MSSGIVIDITTAKPFNDHEPTQDDPKHGGGNGGGGDMLERVRKLEDQVTSIATDVAIIKSNYATKADLHEEIGKQTKWIAVTIIGTVSVAMAVAKFIF